MATDVWSDFFETTLSAAVTSSQTTISVASATNAPTIGANQQWVVVVQSASTPSSREVMYVTAITSTTFTVTRAQEGTSAGTWAVGDYVIGTNTAGQMAALAQVFSGGTAGLSSNTTLAAGNANIYYVVTGGTQTLPAASTVTGQTFGFNAGAACTIASAGGSFQGGALTGSTSVALADGDWLIVQSDGTNYRVVSASPSVLGVGQLAKSQTWTGTNTFANVTIDDALGVGGNATVTENLTVYAGLSTQTLTVTSTANIEGNMTCGGIISDSNAEAINIGAGGILVPSQATLTVDNATGIAGQFRTAVQNGSAVNIRVDNDNSNLQTSYFGTTIVGSISTNTVNTSYNTSSDERIKTGIVSAPYDPTWITKVQVRQFEFVHAPGKPQIGAIAQELVQVAPEAVAPGDANTALKPGDEGFRMWGVDSSKLVWRMLLEIQQLRARLDAMEKKG
ncbi:MAG TPA: tail fiber domain-containing protein [Acetobacteraceae bacterium]|nr:tail fiber domain-containing protein [Acetobacteraceae bacterium]